MVKSFLTVIVERSVLENKITKKETFITKIRFNITEGFIDFRCLIWCPCPVLCNYSFRLIRQHFTDDLIHVEGILVYCYLCNTIKAQICIMFDRTVVVKLGLLQYCTNLRTKADIKFFSAYLFICFQSYSFYNELLLTV